MPIIMQINILMQIDILMQIHIGGTHWTDHNKVLYPNMMCWARRQNINLQNRGKAEVCWKFCLGDVIVLHDFGCIMEAYFDQTYHE